MSEQFGEKIQSSSHAIDLRVVSPAILAGGSVAYFSSAFHFGYFYPIGYEFITFVGSSEWLFSLGSMLPSFLIAIGVFFSMRFSESADVLSKTGKVYELPQALTQLPDWAWLVVLITLISSKWMLCNGLVAAVVALALIFCTSLLAHSLVISQLVVHSVSAREFAIFVLVSGLTATHLGGINSLFVPSTSCRIVAIDGRALDGLFLRSLGDGILFRAGQRLVFFPKEKILEMSCGTSA